METMIRKASSSDIDAIAAIYDNIHTEKKQGAYPPAGYGGYTRRGLQPKRHLPETTMYFIPLPLRPE